MRVPLCTNHQYLKIVSLLETDEEMISVHRKIFGWKFEQAGDTQQDLFHHGRNPAVIWKECTEVQTATSKTVCMHFKYNVCIHIFFMFC